MCLYGSGYLGASKEMKKYSHPTSHDWPKTSHDESNNNRWQPNAPFFAYCGRCRKVYAVDEEWVRVEVELEKEEKKLDWRGNPRDPAQLSEMLQATEQILMSKIMRWRDKNITLTGIDTGSRGRLEVEWVEQEHKPVPVDKQPRGFWTKLLRIFSGRF